MNHFTKEELEDMISWANVYTKFGQCWSYFIHQPLMDKIQLIIDAHPENNSPNVADLNHEE